jgi:hypothetical protein
MGPAPRGGVGPIRALLAAAIALAWAARAAYPPRGAAGHLADWRTGAGQGWPDFVQLARRTHLALALGEVPKAWTTADQKHTRQALQAIRQGPDLRGRYLAARALGEARGVTAQERGALHDAVQLQADRYVLERALPDLPPAEQAWLREYLRHQQPVTTQGPLVLVQAGRTRRSIDDIPVRAEQDTTKGVPRVMLGPQVLEAAREALPAFLPRRGPANVVVLPEGAGRAGDEDPGRLGPLGRVSQNAFQAYDCSTPYDLELVRLPETRPCSTAIGTEVLMTVPNVTYQVLQEAQTVPISVKRCRLTRSSLPAYCGNADHQTIATHDVEIDRPVHVSREDCEGMWRTGQVSISVKDHYEAVRQRTFKLQRNQTTRLTYTSHGTTWYDDDEVQCEGARWYSKAEGMWIGDMVVARSDKIRLDQDLAYADGDGLMELTQGNVMLPAECTAERGYCYTEQGTYVWGPPPPSAQCRMHVIRKTHGAEVTVREKGETLTIFGDDEQHIRLVVRDSIIKCGMALYRTNFPRLFLFRGDHPVVVAAQRPLPDHEFSLALHFKQQAGWMTGHFQGRLEQYVGQLLHQRCEDDRNQQKVAYADLAARQASHREMEAIALGGGQFALPAGEAWRRYRCRPLQAHALNEGACYDALPVALAPEDRNRIAAADPGRANHTERYYLTPGSRIVTTVAAEVPCSALLAPVYQNLQGRWVQATPALMPSPPPKTLHVDEGGAKPAPTFEAMPDFATRGLYSPQQLDEVQRRRRAKRQIAAAESQLERAWERAQELAPGGVPRLSEGLLADVGIPPASLSALASLAGSKFYTFLQDYGTIMAAFTGTYILYRWGIAIWHAIYRCLLPLHGFHSWAGRAAGAICPWVTQAVYEYKHTTENGEEPLYVAMNPMNDPSKPGRYVCRVAPPAVAEVAKADSAEDLQEPPQQLDEIMERLRALEGVNRGGPRLNLPRYHLEAMGPNRPDAAAAAVPGYPVG